MTSRKLVPLAFAALLASACHHHDARHSAPPATDDLSRFALQVVEAARGPQGLGPDLVDSDLVERIHRMQLVRRTELDTHDPAKLLQAFSGAAGADPQVPPAQRAEMQRQRASRGLRAMLGGECTAERFDQGRDARIHYLTDPMEKVPDEIRRGQDVLRQRLAKAELVRVKCKRGEVGMLVVPTDKGPRLVDVFGTTQQTVRVSPDDPHAR